MTTKNTSLAGERTQEVFSRGKVDYTQQCPARYATGERSQCKKCKGHPDQHQFDETAYPGLWAEYVKLNPRPARNEGNSLAIITDQQLDQIKDLQAYLIERLELISEMTPSGRGAEVDCRRFRDCAKSALDHVHLIQTGEYPRQTCTKCSRKFTPKSGEFARCPECMEVPYGC